jgi:hypothetical protein
MSSTYPATGSSKAAMCNYCSKVLGKQYYFTCHICGATYCYIHITKHSRFHKPAASIVVTK